MKTFKKVAVIVAISLLFGAGIGLLLRYSSGRLIDWIEYVTYDWRYRLKYQGTEANEFPNYGIHIVDIDERSMEKMGSYWGWNRGYQASMVDALSSRFPASIAFDIVFYDHEDSIRYERFADVLNEAVSGEPALERYSGLLNKRLAASVNYDARFEAAIARSGRVTMGLSMADESNYRDFASQVAHRMGMEWHNSLSPVSALSIPDSLRKRILHVKTIIDGIYPENAHAARDIGHLNVFDPTSSVIREMPFFYRFGEFEPVYLPMSMRVAATLFGTPNEEIVFKPEQYVDLGKPFKIFRETDGRVRFSYPDFTEAQLRAILADADGIGGFTETGPRRNISAYLALYRDASGRACLETRGGQLTHEATEALRNIIAGIPANDDTGQTGKTSLGVMEIDDKIDIGYRFTAIRDSEEEWEVFSGDESFWLTALDIKTLSTLTQSDFEIEEGRGRKLITFDFWVKREGGILVSPLPVLRGNTLNELLAAGEGVLESIGPGERRDFGDPARIPLRRHNLHIITYFGPKSKPFPYFSFYDVMENNVQYPMEGSVFIVGSTSPALFDIKAAPHDRVFPAVEIHASVMNSIFTGTYVRRLTEWQDLLILVAVGFAAAIIAFLTKPLAGGIIAIASLFVYAFAAFQVFDTSLLWIEMVRPIIAIVLSFSAVMIYRYVTEEKNRKYLQDTFKQYLSPELIDMMYTQKQKPQLGGDTGELTAFFTDIESFSTFSEKLGSPARLVELLNEYLTAMTDILLTSRGTLDKYVGDAIIAFFGAPMYTPEHPVQACRTALAMQHKLGELRGKWSSETEKNWPEIVHHMRMRIGINTGEITTGNMGSAVRMNYTMMGDAVNLAARLESAAKYYGVYTMISSYTYNKVKDVFETRKLDVITVVGKSEPVTIYELICEKGKMTAEETELTKLYNLGVDRYYAREFEKALDCFTKADELEPNRKISPVKQTPSRRFSEMCKKYMAEPPGIDWDGVNRLTSK